MMNRWLCLYGSLALTTDETVDAYDLLIPQLIDAKTAKYISVMRWFMGEYFLATLVVFLYLLTEVNIHLVQILAAFMAAMVGLLSK